MKNDFNSTDSTTNVAVLEDKKWVMLGQEDTDFDSSATYGDKNTLVCDKLDTEDGFEVWWLHTYDKNDIQPNEMFSDEYSYIEMVEGCLEDRTDQYRHAINKVINYTIEVDDFKDMVNKANEILAEVD